MKIALCLALASSAAAAMVPSKVTRSLLKASRRLEQQQGDDNNAEEDEYAFLADYQLKLLSCKAGEVYVNPENGEYEYASVVFRLCPNTGECADEGHEGCSSGYGDFVVGLNSFVQEYLEAKKEEMQGDDDFNMEEYGECREYEVDQDAADDEDEQEQQEQQQYFVGPACSEDETDIVLDFFLDEDCTQTSEDVTFADISNGMELPYSSGGLVSNYCESCAGYNDDGEYELYDLCTRLYENAGKCESNMDTYHYSGMDEQSCEFIEELLPKADKMGAGKMIGWIIFGLVVVGAGFVAYTMSKKKDDRTAGLMNQ